MQKPHKSKKNFGDRHIPVMLAIILTFAYLPASKAADNDNELNFKIYNPETPGAGESAKVDDRSSGVDSNNVDNAALSNGRVLPTPSDVSAATLQEESVNASDLKPEMPVSAVQDTEQIPAKGNNHPDSNLEPASANNLTKEVPASDTSAIAPPSPNAGSPIVNSKSATSLDQDKTNEASSGNASSGQTQASSDTTAGAETAKTDDTDNKTDGKTDSTKVLQGYVQVVPSGTKIPIIMDTAVDSDTSQEGDEFSARTAEDLSINGTTVVPAGSIIKGRIATLNAPKHLDRSGSVALKFDTVTTPDNRQIPLMANLVARGGVVHARRGIKDVAIDAGIFSLPTAIGLGIGVIAGNSSTSSISPGGAALIGAGVGAAVGLAVLLAKKGIKVDVRPGDELKIELTEDLHMPTM
jgi:hypothetical protein